MTTTQIIVVIGTALFCLSTVLIFNKFRQGESIPTFFSTLCALGIFIIIAGFSYKSLKDKFSSHKQDEPFTERFIETSKVNNTIVCPSCKDTLVVPLGDSANVYCTHCNKTFEVASINTIGGVIFKATGKEFKGKLDSLLPINEDRSGYLVNRAVKLGEQAVKMYLIKNNINVKIDTVQLQAIEDSLLNEYSKNALKTMSNIVDKMNN